jgi:NAD(P)-dependent dehydrogenase (short-subunit alcohol dehydrogenase family)
MSSEESRRKGVFEKFQLRGRVAIITGGARGLGRQHALALAEAGADVAICDLLAAEGEQTRREIEALGVRAIAGVVNVTRTAEIEAFVGRVERELGPVRVLVNNAARPSEGCALLDLGEDLWREILETNLSSVFYFSKSAATRMVAGKVGGSIINVASINATVISNIAPRYNATYCATKAAVVQLTKAMAAQWAPHGIRVNALAPGHILTEQTSASAALAGVRERIVEHTPMKRYGELDELKGAIVYLASDASTFMTGSTLAVDGGYTVW